MKKILLFAFLTYSVISSAQGVWIRLPDFPGLSRNGATSFSIGNKAYMLCGENMAGYAMTEFWEWDATTAIWTQLTDFPVGPREGAAGFAIGNKGYFVTGLIGDSESPTRAFWEWDQASGIWTQLPDFPWDAKSYATGFAIGNKGYLAVGNNSGAYPTTEFWEWDQPTGVWTQKTNFPGNRKAGAAGFAIGTKAYLVCGIDSDNKTNKEFWQWDQTTALWTQLTDFPGQKRTGASGFSIGTKGYMVTGESLGWPTVEFWEYTSTVLGSNTIEISPVAFSPNPSTGKFSVFLNNHQVKAHKIKIDIINIVGETIHNAEYSINRLPAEINLSNQPAGIYFIRVSVGDSIHLQKVVKL